MHANLYEFASIKNTKHQIVYTRSVEEFSYQFTLHSQYMRYQNPHAKHITIQITYLLTTFVTFVGKKEGIDCWKRSLFALEWLGKRNARKTSRPPADMVSYSDWPSSPWLFRNLNQHNVPQTIFVVSLKSSEWKKQCRYEKIRVKKKEKKKLPCKSNKSTCIILNVPVKIIK